MHPFIEEGNVKRLIAFITLLCALSACSARPTPVAERATLVPVATSAPTDAPIHAPTSAPTASPTAMASATNMPTATITASATPVPASNRLLVGYGEVQGSSMTGKGIYVLDLKTHQRQPVLEGDYLLQALASDGDSLLISSGAQLFRYQMSEGGDPVLLTDQFDPRIRHMETLATWLDDHTIAFATTSSIQLMNLSDGSTRPLEEGFFLLPEILPSTIADGVYWRDDTLPNLRYDRVDGKTALAYNRFPPACISQDGEQIAYKEPGGYRFLVSNINGSSEHTIFGPESPVYRLQILWSQGGGIYRCAWSPNGQQILLSINTQMASPWEGEYRHFILNADGKLVSEIPVDLIGNEWLVGVWTPDGQSILFYYLNHGFSILTAKSFSVEDLSMQLGISETNAVDRAYWLP